MQCRYCRAWNEEDERRCVRCGRRLHLALARGAGRLRDADAERRRLRRSKPFREAESRQRRCRSRLQTRELKLSTIVIPRRIRRPQGNPNSDVDARCGPRDREESAHRARCTPGASQRRARRAAESGFAAATDFDFQRTNQAPGMQVEAVIYCDAPVALPAHRLIAAAFDASMVLIAVGLFLAIFFLSGGDTRVDQAKRAVLSRAWLRAGAVLPVPVVPGQWRYARHALRRPAAGGFRRPRARSRPARHAPGREPVEPPFGWVWVGVGAGRRREPHLARPYLEDVSDAPV